MNAADAQCADLKTTLAKAVSQLFEHQPKIFSFTPETGQTEWNLAHHLAIELQGFFRDLDCDLDVVKRDYGDRRPDIVFHKRGTNESNFLVIEIKRDGDSRDVEADIAKVHEFWFKGDLHYQFGAVVDIRSNRNHRIEVFKSPG